MDETTVIRRVFTDLYLGRISEPEAEHRLAEQGPEVLASLLVDVFNRASGVRPLFCDQDGRVI